MNAGDISVQRQGEGFSLAYDGLELIEDLGIGLPIDGVWRWTFDGSIRVLEAFKGTGRDRLGRYSYEALVYAVPGVYEEDVPAIRQELRAYGGSRLMVETTALEDIGGTYVEDSFHDTTFNSPVMLLREDLNYLAYTWGLIALESSRDGGHFPEAVTGKGLASLPSKLRQVGYSPREDLSTISRKPFGPLILYDDRERTLVAAPFNHLLISPLRVIQAPTGMAVARGLHGSVDRIPRNTTTRTALVFGQGVVETVYKLGDWLLETGGKDRAAHSDHPLLGTAGYWNCFGGYYTELFRKADEKVLQELSAHFRDAKIPIGYFGLDLWYSYGQVGFARSYRPDPAKYPRGLEAIHREIGLPYLLHMSAFDTPNDYLNQHEFTVGPASSYPMERGFYEGLAGDFESWGALGIWPDFLRTQLQNSPSLRSRIGGADRWFDDLAGAFGERGMAVMMCMPTIGHYLASTRHRNVLAVRTHTDYLNHQAQQVEALRVTGQVRNFMPFQDSVRHNVLLSLLAGSLGLAPSYDVFLTNRNHPEGFAEPNAEYEALLRAMSAGVVAVGDKAGFIDGSILGRLCFPDGRTARPDHPPLPVVSTLQSDVLAFYTTTTVGGAKWMYLAAFNIGREAAGYSLDLEELFGGGQVATVYDHFVGRVVRGNTLEGGLEPAQGHYYVVMPRLGNLHFLGFPDKYITVSSRQVTGVQESDGRVTVSFRLPSTRPADLEKHTYVVALYGVHELEVRGNGTESLNLRQEGELTYVEFATKREDVSLTSRPVHETRLSG